MKILVFYLIIINIFTFLLYGLDKWKAKHHRWRISESALLLAALVGGSVGALSGMYGFHHKTLHKKVYHRRANFSDFAGYAVCMVSEPLFCAGVTG